MESTGARVVCAECARLESEREYLQRIYDQAADNIRISYSTTEFHHYMALKNLADDEQRDLELLFTRISWHRDEHDGIVQPT